MLSASLGHEIISVFAVVSAFFSGLALGAWLLDRFVSRRQSPANWYVVFEVVIGVWALALLRLLPELNHIVSGLIGIDPSSIRHWAISFAYPFFALLPATFAMGGTLPAMDQLFERLKNDRHAVAGLYSVNTFGAVTGTFLVTFIALPLFGMDNTSLILVFLNFLGAAGVFALARADTPVYRSEPSASSSNVSVRRLYPVLFITGVLGIGFEVLMVRVLSQLFENTVFSFAAMLMVFLFGTALGAGIYQISQRAVDSGNSLSRLLLSTAMFCMVSIFLLRFVEPLFDFLMKLFGHGLLGAVTAELSIAVLFFLLPTASMGATFSHMAQSMKGRNSGVGRALCLNTLGGAVAPILFGIFLLPAIGIKFALLIIPAAYTLCIPRLNRAFAVFAVLLIASISYISYNMHPYQLVSLSQGDTLVSHKEGIMATVSVVKDNRDGVHLRVNNQFQMGGTTSVFSDRRQAYLPLLLHPNPEKVLFLGLGTGATFSAAADFPDIEAIGVELIPEVIEVMPHFEKVTGPLHQQTSLHIINADARRYVTATDQNFDVVIADLFHPGRDGASSLYTREHFNAIQNLLTENGIFCQWLPLYQLDMDIFKIITKTFLKVFPEGQAYLAHYSIDQPIVGLVAGKQALKFPEKWYRQRVRGKNLRKHMANFGYDSIYSLLGTFIADSGVLKTYVDGYRINTDNFPIVLFKAPRFVYGKPEPPHQRLLTLLAAFSPPDPEAILSDVITEEDYLARSRLSNYWMARDRFIELGTTVGKTNDVTQLHAAASEQLLDVVKKSIDFSAAYFPLISIAYEIYPYNRKASYKLLRDLERANPMRPEAGILRQKLFVN
jgi:spermidine synthase